MENAIDALKMAFAVIIFVMALTLAIVMFSQLNEVSQIVLASSDVTQFYTYEIATDEEQSRIVGLETIIPTLYKYYKENYTVLFLKENGDPLPLYNSLTDRMLWGSGSDPVTKVNPNAGIIAKYYTKNTSDYEKWDNRFDKESVCSFDVDEETIRHEPWTGTRSDFKENLDAFLNGGTFGYPNGSGDKYQYTKSEQSQMPKEGGFIGSYSDRKFKETLGEYTYNLTEEEDGNTLLKNRKKRVIIYQLQPN